MTRSHTIAPLLLLLVLVVTTGGGGAAASDCAREQELLARLVDVGNANNQILQQLKATFSLSLSLSLSPLPLSLSLSLSLSPGRQPVPHPQRLGGGGTWRLLGSTGPAWACSERNLRTRED